MGPLAASGTGLVDQGNGGAPVTLRGVEVDAPNDGPLPGGFIDANALTTLKDWGANFVRLSISSDQILEECSNESYDWSYQSELTQAVQQLTAAGIYVVLSIGGSNPDCLWTSSQGSGTVPLPGYDVQTAMGVLVGLFGSNRLVGYEPFNEPEGCALSTSGTGATEFVPTDTQSGNQCATETQANLAWNGPGTVITGAQNILGIMVGGERYQTPGMDQLYETIESSLPGGAPTPLVFMDANGWAADASTFDAMNPALAGASNIVQVFHPYDCQDRGSGTAACDESNPEACATAAANVNSYLVDPHSGGPWARPSVFDEFNFPAGEKSYYYTANGLLGSTRVPILMYQHGLWVNNTIAAMQSAGAAGWAIYFFQNADVNDYQDPYSMMPPGVGSSTPVPWTPNANAAPAVSAMQGTQLSCQEPPLGFG